VRFLLSLSLVLGLAGSAFGADYFDCTVKENGQNVKVRFGIKNLATPSRASLLNLGSEDNGPIFVYPQRLKNKYLATMNTLNDQGGALDVFADRLRLFGDGDGYTYVDLVLYKNSGFTRGYVRVYGSGDKWYQKIACTHSRR
jgi:hypothetical protein